MLNKLKKNILNYLLILMRLGNSPDIGILILRVFSGATMLMNHGIYKISAGTIKWERLGSALTDLIGFESLKIFFGFMASFAESIGAIFIMSKALLKTGFLEVFADYLAHKGGEKKWLTIFIFLLTRALRISSSE